MKLDYLGMPDTDRNDPPEADGGVRVAREIAAGLAMRLGMGVEEMETFFEKLKGACGEETSVSILSG